jgi:Methyltransferase domain
MNKLIVKSKLGLHKWFCAQGFDITRYQESRVSGTFPPHEQYLLTGKAENYFIHDGYKYRTEVSYFDDTGNADEWQREVYRFAREVFDERHLSKVCDIGCGSAFKLLRHFANCEIVGFDINLTCEWLRKKYPAHTWVELDFKNPPATRADLVIAADVIEHVLYPEELFSFVLALNPQYVVFSTPDRNLLNNGTHDGPPLNSAHIREWSYAEFQAYVGSRFKVVEHFISNRQQGTQCLLCVPLR